MQAIVDKMRSDFHHIEYRRVRIKGSASQNELFPSVRAHCTITIFLLSFFFFFFFFFFHQIDIQEFWGRYICIKTVNVKTNRYSFFTERLAVRLR